MGDEVIAVLFVTLVLLWLGFTWGYKEGRKAAIRVVVGCRGEPALREFLGEQHAKRLLHDEE